MASNFSGYVLFLIACDILKMSNLNELQDEIIYVDQPRSFYTISSIVGSIICEEEQNLLLKILIINELILLCVLYSEFCTYF